MNTCWNAVAGLPNCTANCVGVTFGFSVSAIYPVESSRKGKQNCILSAGFSNIPRQILLKIYLTTYHVRPNNTYNQSGFIFKPSPGLVTSRAINETFGDIASPNWQLSCIFHSKLFVTIITKYLANLFVTDVAEFTDAYVQPRGKRGGGGWGWRSDQRRRLIKTDCSRIVLFTLPARVLNEIIDLVRSFARCTEVSLAVDGRMPLIGCRYGTGRRQPGVEKVGGRRSGRPWPENGPKRHRRRRIRRVHRNSRQPRGMFMTTGSWKQQVRPKRP
jgi:hypothetical protein